MELRTGRTSRKGRAMARDMSNIYRFKTVKELNTLRSKKVVALERLRGEAKTYFVMQEIKRQEHLLGQIDAEIACKRAQLSMFE